MDVLPLESFSNIRQMHLDAVLVFVRALRHVGEFARLL